MKIKLVYCVLFLSFVGCNAQKTTKMEQDIIIPEITNEFEKFDVDIFNKEVDTISGKRLIKKDSIYIEEDYQNPGFSKVVYGHFSSFYLLKLYFENGNIKEKGISFNNGSEHGIWYEFDEDGKMIKEINTDEGYDFDWKNILEYCHKNNIKLTKGYPKSGGVHTEIYKIEEEGKKVWQITYYDYKEEQLFEVVLDGKNGKELKRRKLEFIGG